jgi:ABC-type polysaccharide/polyol phosphate export permease
MQVACITFVFKFAGFATNFRSYSAYVLVAIIPWTFFQTATLDACQSILLMYSVIKKVYLPREVVPLSSAISNFIHFLMSWCVFFAYLLLYVRAPLPATAIWFPYLLLVQLMLVAGMGLLVSCLNVFYEDVKYIVTVLLNLLFFLTPIMYVFEQIYFSHMLQRPDKAWIRFLFLWNPMTGLINGYRKALLEPPDPASIGGHPSLPLDVTSLLITGAVSFAILVLSYAYFNSRKWQFVERP